MDEKKATAKALRRKGYKVSPSYKQDEFLFNLDGLIGGEFVTVETDSAEVIIKIIKLMDSQNK